MNLPGTFERCMSGHYYACVRGDEECPICPKLTAMSDLLALAKRMRKFLATVPKGAQSALNEDICAAIRKAEELASGPSHQFTATPCGRALTAYERHLERPLTLAEMSEFLLDNFIEIATIEEAHQIRDSVLI